MGGESKLGWEGEDLFNYTKTGRNYAGTDRPRRRWPYIVVSLILLVVVAFVGLGLFFYQALDLERAFGVKDRPVSILLLGTDRTYDERGRPISAATRADTIILLCLNPQAREAHIVSIPRDTRARIPGRGFDKVNAAHAKGGVPLTIETVEGLLSLPVDRYVEVDFRGFIKLVDMLGGVEIEVDKDMHYVDRGGGLRIDLKQGLQRLNGEEALQYARYRNDALGDIARVGRHQKLLKAMMKEALDLKKLRKVPDMFDEAMKYVNTDLSPREIASIAWFLWRTRDRGFESTTLPGEFSRYYWLPDKEAIRGLVSHISRGFSPTTFNAN